MEKKKIKELNIEKFRHLENAKISLGEKLTIISGGNGTGKTSILGLLAHIFSSKSKGLDGKFMTAKFSDVFKFSETFDIGGSHKYNILFDDDTIKKATSRETIEKGKKRFRIDVGIRETDGGKVNRPLIYLGLKRLVPLAQERETSIKIGEIDNLSDDEKVRYQDYHNKIFSTNSEVTPVHTKSSNKSIYSPTTTNYDSYGVSAGQDNIGQIILSLLSFQNLKEKEKKYNGGLLIIDELDATLYPAVQKNLLDILLKESGKLNLQVIFTTHSTDILTHVLEDKIQAYDKHCNIVFLNNANGDLTIYQDHKNLEQILANLNHKVSEKIPPPIKTNIYFEDEEARIFFKNLIKLEKGLSKVLKIQPVNLGETFYKELLNKKFPEFNKSIIVLDGDAKGDFRGSLKPKLCFLPGIERPENVLYNFLLSLDKSDSFWDSELGGYTKSVFNQNKPPNITDRKVMKSWFNDNKKHWGLGCTRLFKRWLEDSKNKKESLKFVLDFKKKIDKIRV